MSFQIFISYASEDIEVARRIHDTLAARALRCFLAERDLGVGERFDKVISETIQTSPVFALLWSRQAATSPHVDREIVLAAEHCQVILPLHLHGAPSYSDSASYYLSSLNWQSYSAGGPTETELERTADQVEENLRLIEVPPPLDRICSEFLLGDPVAVTRGDLDQVFRRHLEAVRILFRFVCLLHIAKYIESPERARDLDQRIAAILEARSLFSDIALTRRILAHLEGHSSLIHPGFHEVFKISSGRMPTEIEIGKTVTSAESADAFDAERLAVLCSARSDLAYPDRVATDAAQKALCVAVRSFLREALAQACFAEVRLGYRVDGSERAAAGSEHASGPEVAPVETAEVWADTPAGKLHLQPFFVVAPREGEFEIAMFRGQDGHSEYRPITSELSPAAYAAPLLLPWTRLQAQRSLPEVVYQGETHEVRLSLRNAGLEDLRVPEVVERLPPNLRSAAGETTVRVAGDILLQGGQHEDFRYEVQGVGRAGALGEFDAEPSLAYCSTDGVTYRAKIAGDSRVKVKKISPPGLRVSRKIFDAGGRPVSAGEKVPLDETLEVEHEVRSEGRAMAGVVLEDRFDGAELVGTEEALLFRGDLARVDRQEPVRGRYEIRVTGGGELKINAAILASAGALELRDGEVELEIEQRPDPRLETRWTGASRVGSGGGVAAFEARLLLSNSGGTTAYDVRIESNAPAEVSLVDPASGEVPMSLSAGASRELGVRVARATPTLDRLELTLTYRSVGRQELEQVVGLPLDRVVHSDLDTIPLIGRREARESVRRFLEERRTEILNVHGQFGVGKALVVRTAFEEIAGRRGGRMALHAADCENVDSLVEGIAVLLEGIVFGPGPVGSRAVFDDFLDGVGMPRSEFRMPAEDFETLIYRREKASPAIWTWVGRILGRLSEARRYDPLVLLLTAVSHFTAEELDELAALHRELLSAGNVRLIVTSREPLSSLDADMVGVEIPLFEPADCRELINAVFILPPAQDSLCERLIRSSELVPSNLKSLISQILADSEAQLDFDHPLGVCLLDPESFERLPTTLLKTEVWKLRAAEVPHEVLAAIVASRQRVEPAVVESVLGYLGREASGDEVRGWLSECDRSEWLRPEGAGYRQRSATVGRALREVVSADLVERAHEALFVWYQKEEPDKEQAFRHLLDTRPEFLRGHEEKLVTGLRNLLNRGSFSLVRRVLNRLEDRRELSPEGALGLSVLEQELSWEATGSLDPETLAELRQTVESTTGKSKSALGTRLSWLESQWLSSRQGDHRGAIEVALAAEWRLGPFRYLPVDGPELRFDYDLNLWKLSYRSLDERRFSRVDSRIWRRLKRKRQGRHDTRAIAEFLKAFLETQQQFKDAEARRSHFPTPMAGGRPLRYNYIEERTRPERIRGSFLNDFLRRPDQLDLRSALLLGRLYLVVGRAEWQSLPSRQYLTASRGRPAERGATPPETAESYLLLAEEMFRSLGSQQDLAKAQWEIAATYVDRSEAAENWEKNDKMLEFCALAVKWLRRALDGFEAIGAGEEALEALIAYAATLLRWSTAEPKKRAEAIRAYEALCAHPLLRRDAVRLDDHRLTLIELYEQEGRLLEAAQMIDEIGIADEAIALHRARIDAETLLAGTITVTARNAGRFHADLDVLRAWISRAGGGAKPGAAPSPAEVTDVSRAIAVLAWYLAESAWRDDNGEEALELLRDYRSEITTSVDLAEHLCDSLCEMLPDLWQMVAPPDAAMIQDFTGLLLPVVDGDRIDVVERMLHEVSQWESTREDGAHHFASGDMSLVLADRLYEQHEADSARRLVDGVLARLEELRGLQLGQLPDLVARGLVLVLRHGAEKRDGGPFFSSLARFLETYADAEEFDGALIMLVVIVESLLDLHHRTENEWYYHIVQRVAEHLRPVQEKSGDVFEVIARLINLYLQLPGRTPDAIDLMERQCERFLDHRSYDELSRYLAFLSDLLGSVRSRRRQSNVLGAMMERLAAAKDGPRFESLEELMTALSAAGDAPEPTSEAESEPDADAAHDVEAVAQELCTNLIGHLADSEMDPSVQRHVLYNAAKLLKGEQTRDLTVAIYVKLYELSTTIDGSCVWGAFQALAGDSMSDQLVSLDDQLALICFSNSQEEDSRGRPEVHHPSQIRNYLICSQARGLLLERLFAATRAPELASAFSFLELNRVGLLSEVARDLGQLLEAMDEFEGMAFVTFLDHYLAPIERNIPFWRRLQRIQDLVTQTRKQVEKKLETYTSHLSFFGETSHKAVVGRLAFDTDGLLASSRRRGREIMRRLVRQIEEFSLAAILSEVHRYLLREERSIDFEAVLGILSSESRADIPSGRTTVADYETLAASNPAARVQRLVGNANDFEGKGEWSLARTLYRLAFEICEADGRSTNPERPTVVQGLSRCARSLGGFSKDDEIWRREASGL